MKSIILPIAALSLGALLRLLNPSGLSAQEVDKYNSGDKVTLAESSQIGGEEGGEVEATTTGTGPDPLEELLLKYDNQLKSYNETLSTITDGIDSFEEFFIATKLNEDYKNLLPNFKIDILMLEEELREKAKQGLAEREIIIGKDQEALNQAFEAYRQKEDSLPQVIEFLKKPIESVGGLGETTGKHIILLDAIKSLEELTVKYQSYTDSEAIKRLKLNESNQSASSNIEEWYNKPNAIIKFFLDDLSNANIEYSFTADADKDPDELELTEVILNVNYENIGKIPLDGLSKFDYIDSVLAHLGLAYSEEIKEPAEGEEPNNFYLLSKQLQDMRDKVLPYQQAQNAQALQTSTDALKIDEVKDAGALLLLYLNRMETSDNLEDIKSLLKEVKRSSPAHSFVKESKKSISEVLKGLNNTQPDDPYLDVEKTLKSLEKMGELEAKEIAEASRIYSGAMKVFDAYNMDKESYSALEVPEGLGQTFTDLGTEIDETGFGEGLLVLKHLEGLYNSHLQKPAEKPAKAEEGTEEVAETTEVPAEAATEGQEAPAELEEVVEYQVGELDYTDKPRKLKQFKGLVDDIKAVKDYRELRLGKAVETDEIFQQLAEWYNNSNLHLVWMEDKKFEKKLDEIYEKGKGIYAGTNIAGDAVDPEFKVIEIGNRREKEELMKIRDNELNPIKAELEDLIEKYKDSQSEEYPYLKQLIEEGKISPNEKLETVEEYLKIIGESIKDFEDDVETHTSRILKDGIQDVKDFDLASNLLGELYGAIKDGSDRYDNKVQRPVVPIVEEAEGEAEKPVEATAVQSEFYATKEVASELEYLMRKYREENPKLFTDAKASVEQINFKDFSKANFALSLGKGPFFLRLLYDQNRIMPLDMLKVPFGAIQTSDGLTIVGSYNDPNLFLNSWLKGANQVGLLIRDLGYTRTSDFLTSNNVLSDLVLANGSHLILGSVGNTVTDTVEGFQLAVNAAKGFFNDFIRANGLIDYTSGSLHRMQVQDLTRSLSDADGNTISEDSVLPMINDIMYDSFKEIVGLGGVDVNIPISQWMVNLFGDIGLLYYTAQGYANNKAEGHDTDDTFHDIIKKPWLWSAGVGGTIPIPNVPLALRLKYSGLTGPITERSFSDEAMETELDRAGENLDTKLIQAYFSVGEGAWNVTGGTGIRIDKTSAFYLEDSQTGDNILYSPMVQLRLNKNNMISMVDRLEDIKAEMLANTRNELAGKDYANIIHSYGTDDIVLRGEGKFVLPSHNNVASNHPIMGAITASLGKALGLDVYLGLPISTLADMLGADPGRIGFNVKDNFVHIPLPTIYGKFSYTKVIDSVLEQYKGIGLTANQVDEWIARAGLEQSILMTYSPFSLELVVDAGLKFGNNQPLTGYGGVRARIR